MYAQRVVEVVRLLDSTVGEEASVDTYDNYPDE